jgi:hypothetical protein
MPSDRWSFYRCKTCGAVWLELESGGAVERVRMEEYEHLSDSDFDERSYWCEAC